MGVINVTKNEYALGDFAISECKVTFLCIPVYYEKVVSTNKQIKEALTVESKCLTTINVKGFKDYEDTDKKN